MSDTSTHAHYGWEFALRLERERVADAQARIAELEKDAARYRWLRLESIWIESRPMDCCTDDEPPVPIVRSEEYLDRYIDAAMQESKT